MTTSLLYQTIDQLSRERGIDPEIVISAVEDAMLVATRKYYKTSEELQSRFNKETGAVEVHAVKKIVEQVVDPNLEISVEEARKYDSNAALESEVRIPKNTDVLSRVAAQAFKQVISQKVREAERDAVYAEYNQRIGELVNCTVKRTEGPDIIVDLGRTEARLPRKEQSRLESYQIGDRLRAVITLVDRAARGPQVIVSRGDAALVQRLFGMEVPEIYDGTVVIRAMAREPGERTKVAVYSTDPDVDCVGACVGMKGARVQSIIREMRGEKIDIIEFDEDPIAFAANALSPAKINHVSILDVEQKQLEVIVDDTQLSLAIGKKGQNVRLAAKLLGWRIDIKSEEEKRQEIESQMAAMALRGAPVNSLSGLGEKTLQKLRDHGVETVEQLAQMTPDELTQIQGIGEKTVERIRRVVTDYFEQAQRVMEASAAAESRPPAAEAGARVEPASQEQASVAESVAEAAATPEAGAKAEESESSQEGEGEKGTPLPEAGARVEPASQEQASAGESVAEEAAVPPAEAKAEEAESSQEGEGEKGTPLPGEGGETE